MISEDDKRFYELLCEQIIHEKRKNRIAKMPERIYDNFERGEKSPENIEEKYEKRLELADSMKKEAELLEKIFGK
jgi:predicted DNA-binding protein YlxM (UPF0122 family)